MKIKKTLCFLLAMIMAFAIAFPESIFAEEYFPEEELFLEENFVSDNWNEEELIDEWPSYDIVDDYYEDWEEFVEYDKPFQNDKVDFIEDEILVEEPVELNENEASAIEDTETTGEFLLVDNETFEAASYKITAQPEDTAVAEGTEARVKVETNDTNASYTWYFKAPGGSLKKSSLKTDEY